MESLIHDYQKIIPRLEMINRTMRPQGSNENVEPLYMLPIIISPGIFQRR